MQRLLEDAEKISGIEYDISSYADIVDAIHVVQTEMGITGTTAAEAEKTISGSAAAMKAAWTNLVAGLADENANVGELLATFLGSVKTTAGNVLPVVKNVLSSIGNMLIENGPEMIANGALLLGKLAVGAVKAIPDIVSKIPEIVTAIVEEFKENGPEFVEIGKTLVEEIWEGIKSLGSWIGGKVSGFFSDIVQDAKSLFSGNKSGIDAGTDSVSYSNSGLGSAAKTIAGSSGGGSGDIVVNVTSEVGGSAVARHQYKYNTAEAQRRGTSLVVGAR